VTASLDFAAGAILFASYDHTDFFIVDDAHLEQNSRFGCRLRPCVQRFSFLNAPKKNVFSPFYKNLPLSPVGLELPPPLTDPSTTDIFSQPFVPMM